MSIRVNIENILQSSDEIFKNILHKITSKTIQNAKSQIKEKYPPIDRVLFEAITLILKDLKNEEGYISRLLYRLFGFEFRENVRRKQLLILGGELKAQYIQIQKSVYKTKVHLENISSTIAILKKLRRAFRDKIMFLVDKRLIDKANFYIDRIDGKIKELEGYSSELDERLVVLESIEKEYKSLLKQIPRYHELNSSVDILLENRYERADTKEKYPKGKRENKRS